MTNTGWTELVSTVSNVFTSGRADSFLHCTHITRSRYGHQVTAAALQILLLKAFRASSSEALNHWSSIRENQSAQFKFWQLILNLQLTIFCLIRSFRERNFNMYVNTLKALVPWFFAVFCFVPTMNAGYQCTSKTL